VSYAIRTRFAKKKICFAGFVETFLEVSCDAAAECFMLYKYRPPAVIIRPAAKSMPQLDFREALSTPEEKLFSPPAALPLAAVPASEKRNIFGRGVRLSRSTWTNIVFVTIASAGGLVCAFYFFNGGELLRAATAWPSEFLYPRPLSTEKIDIGIQPTAVDQYERSASAPGEKPSEQPVNTNASNPTLPQPPTTTGTTTPPGITGPGPGTSLLSTLTSLISEVNTLPSGADSLYQSVYQTAISTTPTKAITRTANRPRSSTRRKVSSTQGKLLSRTTTATSVQKSTAQSVQQTPNQTQTFSAIQAPNQMMMGGIGGVGGIGGMGAGLGGTGGLGSVGSGLGGLGGLGGHH
jgi:hypothetical protein